MFIISIASFNSGKNLNNLENLKKMTYPNDIEGNLCGWDAQDYKILYYTTLDDPVITLVNILDQEALC